MIIDFIGGNGGGGSVAGVSSVNGETGAVKLANINGYSLTDQDRVNVFMRVNSGSDNKKAGDDNEQGTAYFKTINGESILTTHDDIYANIEITGGSGDYTVCYSELPDPEKEGLKAFLANDMYGDVEHEARGLGAIFNCGSISLEGDGVKLLEIPENADSCYFMYKGDDSGEGNPWLKVYSFWGDYTLSLNDYKTNEWTLWEAGDWYKTYIKWDGKYLGICPIWMNAGIASEDEGFDICADAEEYHTEDVESVTTNELVYRRGAYMSYAGDEGYVWAPDYSARRYCVDNMTTEQAKWLYHLIFNYDDQTFNPGYVLYGKTDFSNYVAETEITYFNGGDTLEGYGVILANGGNWSNAKSALPYPFRIYINSNGECRVNGVYGNNTEYYQNSLRMSYTKGLPDKELTKFTVTTPSSYDEGCLKITVKRYNSDGDEDWSSERQLGYGDYYGWMLNGTTIAEGDFSIKPSWYTQDWDGQVQIYMQSASRYDTLSVALYGKESDHTYEFAIVVNDGHEYDGTITEVSVTPVDKLDSLKTYDNGTTTALNLGLKAIKLTQAEYDALEEHDDDIMYVIVG